MPMNDAELAAIEAAAKEMKWPTAKATILSPAEVLALISRLRAAEQRAEAAEAVVARLLVTADGAQILPGDTVWRTAPGENGWRVIGFRVMKISQYSAFDVDGEPHCPDYLYSKESLAVAARENAATALAAANRAGHAAGGEVGT